MAAKTFVYLALLILLAGAVAVAATTAVPMFAPSEAEPMFAPSEAEPNEGGNTLASTPDFTVLAYRYGPTEVFRTESGYGAYSVSEQCVDYVFAGAKQTSCVAVNVSLRGGAYDGLLMKDVSAKFEECMRIVTIGLGLPECWRSFPPYVE